MSRISRRRFLEESLWTASAALAATHLPGAARAQTPPAGRAVGPNDKIRMACIGVHGRGMAHIAGYLSQPDAVIVAVCDVDTSVSARAARRIEEATGTAPRVYQDLRKLYEDKDVDAVSMALPIHWHTLAALWAMQSGKDVYVEKPISHNVSEGRRLTEAARRYNRICQAGTQSRSARATQEAIRYIHDGKIGRVTLARGLCYKPRGSIGIKPDGPVPSGVDYDIWLGPAPKRPFNPNRFHYEWHWNWDYGAGDLGNQGIHQMDIARWALNKEELPRSVLSLGGRFGYVDQGETPNTLVSFYDYGDVPLIFEVRGLRTDDLMGVQIGDIVYGTDGYVVFTSNYGRARAFHPDGSEAATFSGGGDHFRNFLDAVRSRKMSDLHAPVSEGHLSSALCHLGNVSYKLGTSVPFSNKTKRFGDDKQAYDTFARFEEHLAANGIKLDDDTYRLGRRLAFDPKQERFTSDKEANALLTRPYRKPFVVPEKI